MNLVQLIVNEGGTYELKASLSDIFVKYDVFLDDGSIKQDSRLNYVLEAKEKGKKIEIIEFKNLLEQIKISEEQLDKMPLVNLDCLYDKSSQIINKSTLKLIKKSNDIKITRIDANGNRIIYQSDKKCTLGDLYGDILDKIMLELDENK